MQQVWGQDRQRQRRGQADPSPLGDFLLQAGDPVFSAAQLVAVDGGLLQSPDPAMERVDVFPLLAHQVDERVHLALQHAQLLEDVAMAGF